MQSNAMQIRQPNGWPGHVKTRSSSSGPPRLIPHRGGLDTRKQVAPARENHVRHLPGCFGHVETSGSNSGQPC
eukprot:2799387-Pyramimonas_sp.AAC.1